MSDGPHKGRFQTDWLQSYTGKMVYPLEAEVDQIELRDIAHALALKCRFNGHCLVFYSVAEHSVRCAQYVYRITRNSRLALQALMHDAAEAYLPDISRPIKPAMIGFKEIEENLMRVICERFGMSDDFDAIVKTADDILLVTEARDLMCAPPEPWKVPATPLEDKIEPMTPQQAEIAFLDMFHYLTQP